ncbi:YkgJ family cysteine cluster protein [Novosphingobium sp. MMS21-SN21R]|uniref:YkgJ family cysteine cluster protein n=1 Tax=Novosphingobium sp. MMS21-SN21R TaxID=2969298 RepID=UPI002883C7FF|nr:YkgJ family cysteine cluster protein [Novosphingobium sp. MMS21-SN21R]MDT0507770.1 YkgJ family cysteine cluster protein [Novosphingobium sp. MMS21-SN21R]
MTAAPTLPEDQHLCTRCGMCCDGTLFEYVEVDESERPSVENLFTLHPGTKGPVFHQPCPHAINQCCMVYEARPETCRKYRCKTLIALDSGEITAHEAARRVDEALQARETVRPLLLDDETMHQARQRRAAIAAEPARAMDSMVFVLRLTALDLMLDKYFRKQGKTMIRQENFD